MVIIGVALGTLVAWCGLFWLAGALDVWADPDWERDRGLVLHGESDTGIDADAATQSGEPET